MRKVICGICVTATLVLYILIYIKQPDSAEITPPKYTIGVVLKAMDSEHWLSVQSSMQKIAQERNLNLIVLYAENESAWEQQSTIIMDLLDNDVDALIVSASNINKTAPYLKKAKEKNVPVFSLDEKIPGVPYIGSDNYMIGQKAAMYMAENLPENSQVGVISGSSNQDAHIQRVKGFTDYIANHTKLKISACLADDMKYRQATIQAENLLSQYPQTKGIFVTSALMALGAIEFTGTLPQHISIVSVDTQNDAISALKNGRIDAIISQDGHETGAMALNAAVDYLTQRRLPKENIYIENDLITRDNAADYLLLEDF